MTGQQAEAAQHAQNGPAFIRAQFLKCKRLQKKTAVSLSVCKKKKKTARDILEDSEKVATVPEDRFTSSCYSLWPASERGRTLILGMV